MSTTNKNLNQPATGSSNWDSALNTNFGYIDSAFGGVTSISGLTSGTTTLTSTQYTPPILKLAGTLTGNVTIQIPSGIGGYWFVYNNCVNTGGNTYTVTLTSGGGGSSVVLTAASYSSVICDGTNVTYSSTVPSAAGGSTTQIQYNNGGTLSGSSSLTWNALSSTFTGTIAASTNTLVVTSPSGTIYPGMTLGTITGGTFTSPTTVTITSQVSGTTGGAGSYSLSQTNTGGAGATVTTASFTALTTNYIIASLTGTALSAINVAGTNNPVGYLQLLKTTSPTVSSATNGYFVYTSSNVTITAANFNVQDNFLIVNSSASPISIIAGTGTTIRFAGSSVTGTRTLAAYGQASVLCVDTGIFSVGGAGVS